VPTTAWSDPQRASGGPQRPPVASPPQAAPATREHQRQITQGHRTRGVSQVTARGGRGNVSSRRAIEALHPIRRPNLTWGAGLRRCADPAEWRSGLAATWQVAGHRLTGSGAPTWGGPLRRGRLAQLMLLRSVRYSCQPSTLGCEFGRGARESRTALREPAQRWSRRLAVLALEAVVCLLVFPWQRP